MTGEQALPLLTSSQNPRACLPTTSRTNYGNPSAPGQQSGAYPLQMGGGTDNGDHAPQRQQERKRAETASHPESLTQRQNKALRIAIQDQPTSRPARQKHKPKIKRGKGAFSFGLSGEAKGQRTHSTRRSEVACKGQES